MTLLRVLHLRAFRGPLQLLLAAPDERAITFAFHADWDGPAWARAMLIRTMTDPPSP